MFGRSPIPHAPEVVGRSPGQPVVRIALVLFVVAGLTGVLFRYAVAYALGPSQLGGLLLANIRHAHSHLMYFGWATPALFALIVATRMARGDGSMPAFRAIVAIVFATALLAYPPFLFWGYGLAQIGEAQLPLAMIAAGLNVVGWYLFVIAYVRTARRAGRDRVRWIFDIAVGFLVLSTLGAWGLAAAQPLGVENPAVLAALVHVFLDTFSEGWFVLGVIGLAAAAVPGAGDSLPRWPIWTIAAGVPLIFPLALPEAYVTMGWRAAGSAGGLLVGIGSIGAVFWLWPRLRGVWRFALACLALKAVGQIVVAGLPGIDWAALHGLRVLYLHLMLLGFVSVGLVTSWRGTGRGSAAFGVAVAILLATLLPLTSLWPDVLRGEWVYHASLWGSIPLVAVALLLALLPERRGQPPLPDQGVVVGPWVRPNRRRPESRKLRTAGRRVSSGARSARRAR